MAILGPLRELDQVAYLRFASVYRQFTSVDDFETEIALLRVEQEPTGIEPLIPDRAADAKVSSFTPHRLTPARPATRRARTARPAVAAHQTPGRARAAGEGLRGSGPVHEIDDRPASSRPTPHERRPHVSRAAIVQHGIERLT